MKTLKQIVSESDFVKPKAPADQDFVDMHVIQKTDYPHTPKGGSNDEVFKGSKQKKKKRIADPEEGEDKKLNDSTDEVTEMSAAKSKRKEAIVMGMKKNTSDFVKRYGKDDAESVMNATATKQAQSEETVERWDGVSHVGVSIADQTLLKSVWENLNDSNQLNFEQAILTQEGIGKMLTFARQGWGE
jgi:hypothetical protein